VIQRLLDALLILASGAETQIERHPEWTCRPDRLAPEYSDALLLMESCQQEALEDDQLDALRAVEAALEESCSSADAWTASALRTDPRWREVRRVAGLALRALGQPDG
jgi:hypothetical protein